MTSFPMSLNLQSISRRKGTSSRRGVSSFKSRASDFLKKPSSSKAPRSPRFSHEAPTIRYWFPKSQTESSNGASSSTSSGFTLTVMSYNILSDNLFKRHPILYTGCKKVDTKWHTRWPRILTEIKRLNPDVLALQEVQNDHFHQDIYPGMEKLSYDGHYKKRTGHNNSDGLALFYKRSRCKLLEVSSLEFNQNRLSLNRDNVALIGRFETVDKQEFLLATTHLLFNPKRFNVRLAQSALLLAELRRLAFIDVSRSLPIIVTGDFNSEPNSLVHQLWTRGRVRLMDNTSFCLRSIGLTSNCVHEHMEEATKLGMGRTSFGKSPYVIDRECSFHHPKGVPFNPYESYFEELSHDFEFQSTEPYDCKGVTSKQDNGWCRVDYIFYTSKSSRLSEHQRGDLKLLEILRSPTSKHLTKASIPNKTFPSDHISQVAKFLLL